MTGEDFDRFLTGELCWLDAMPTTASHAGQRQCPHCRRKWSYATLRRQWALARAYCTGRTRRQAARDAGTDVHTAGRHFQRFQGLLAVYFVESVKHGKYFADAERVERCCRETLRTPDVRKRLLLAVELQLEELSVAKRLQLLYRLAFRERVNRLTRSALASLAVRQSSDKPSRTGATIG